MFESLCSKNIYELSDKIKCYAKDFNYTKQFISGHQLAYIARSFHKQAGTLTPRLEKSIEKLERNELRCLIAHQPNMFPSMGVVAPFILLERLTELLSEEHGISIAPFYFMVDYDWGDNARFRSAKFPDIFRQSGLLNYTDGIPRRRSRALMWLLEKPPRTLVSEWILDTHRTIHSSFASILASGVYCMTDIKRYRDFVLSNLELIQDLIWESYERASSLTEFNAFLLSKIVNIHWDQEICFIPGHLVHAINGKSYDWITHQSNEIIQIAQKAISILTKYGYTPNFRIRNGSDTFLWYICEKCLQRITIERMSTGQLVANHNCSALGYSHTVSFDANQVEYFQHNIYPKVLIDNILDTIALNKVGGTGYIGQADHMLISNYIAANLGLNPPPQIIFAARGLYFGLTELCVSANLIKNSKIPTGAEVALRYSYLGKASIIYHIVCMGMHGIYSTWYDFFKNTENVHKGNTQSIRIAPHLESVFERTQVFKDTFLRAKARATI